MQFELSEHDIQLVSQGLDAIIRRDGLNGAARCVILAQKIDAQFIKHKQAEQKQEDPKDLPAEE